MFEKSDVIKYEQNSIEIHYVKTHDIDENSI